MQIAGMPNPFDLSGRTIIVARASSGIGRETALLLSKPNARVVVARRDVGRLQAVVSSRDGVGRRSTSFDLRCLDDIAGAIPRMRASYSCRLLPPGPVLLASLSMAAARPPLAGSQGT